MVSVPRRNRRTLADAGRPIPRKLAIVGGGLAGLAAAEAATRAGWGVELFEARSRLGGRAGSLRDPQGHGWIDCCQHLTLDCCSELADFCRRLEVSDCFRRFGRIHFSRRMVPGTIYPPRGGCRLPLHLLPSLLRLGYLSIAERWGIVRAMARLAHRRPATNEPTTIGAWLEYQGQSAAAVQRFWTPILVSALGDRPEALSVAAARQVFAEAFLDSRHGYELYLPNVSLAELYDRRVAEALRKRGVTIHRSAPVLRRGRRC